MDYQNWICMCLFPVWGRLAGVGVFLVGVWGFFEGGRGCWCFLKVTFQLSCFAPLFFPSKDKLVDNTMGISFTCVMCLKNKF